MNWNEQGAPEQSVNSFVRQEQLIEEQMTNGDQDRGGGGRQPFSQNENASGGQAQAYRVRGGGNKQDVKILDQSGRSDLKTIGAKNGQMGTEVLIVDAETERRSPRGQKGQKGRPIKIPGSEFAGQKPAAAKKSQGREKLGQEKSIDPQNNIMPLNNNFQIEDGEESYGEPRVIDMTEEEIAEATLQEDIFIGDEKIGEQKYFDNRAQILSQTDEKKISIASMGLMSQENPKMKAQAQQNVFTPGSFTGRQANSLLSSNNILFGKNYQMNGAANKASISSNEKAANFQGLKNQNKLFKAVEQPSTTQQSKRSKLSKNSKVSKVSKFSKNSKNSESMTHQSMVTSKPNQVPNLRLSLRNMDEKANMTTITQRAAETQPQSAKHSNSYLRKCKQSTIYLQLQKSDNSSFLNKLQKAKKPINGAQITQNKKQVIKASQNNFFKNSKLNKSASNQHISNPQQNYIRNPTLTLSGLVPRAHQTITIPDDNPENANHANNTTKNYLSTVSIDKATSTKNQTQKLNLSGIGGFGSSKFGQVKGSSLCPALKFGSIGASAGLQSNTTRSRKLSLHKKSLISNQSINSRHNIQSNNRPNNNPFNDFQSFSSNGMGQIVGLQLTNRARKMSKDVGNQIKKNDGTGPADDYENDKDSQINSFEGDQVSLGSKGGSNSRPFPNDPRNRSVDQSNINQINLNNYKVFANKKGTLHPGQFGGTRGKKILGLSGLAAGAGNFPKVNLNNSINVASVNLMNTSGGWKTQRNSGNVRNDQLSKTFVLNRKKASLNEKLKPHFPHQIHHQKGASIQNSGPQKAFSPKSEQKPQNEQTLALANTYKDVKAQIENQNKQSPRFKFENKGFQYINQKIKEGQQVPSPPTKTKEGSHALGPRKTLQNTHSLTNLHLNQGQVTKPSQNIDKNFQAILEDKAEDTNNAHSRQPSLLTTQPNDQANKSKQQTQSIKITIAPDTSNVTSETQGLEPNSSSPRKNKVQLVSSSLPNGSSANPQQPSSAIGVLRGSSLSGQQNVGLGLQSRTSHLQEKIEEESPPEPEFPLSAKDALLRFSNLLSEYEKQELPLFDNQIYYLGENCKKKIKGYVLNLDSPRKQEKSAQHIQRHKERLKQMNIFNHGYDDEQGDYQVILKDHLAYRYEVLEFLGQGSFGQAIKCYDHKSKEDVAIKIIRNKKKFQYQAGIELRILKYLNYHDKYDMNNIIRVNDYTVFRKHLLISFECLSINLYEFIKSNNFQGVSQSLIRRFAIQVLQALKYQKDHRIIHCDLKPENILLKQQNKSGIKVIDYGSSCFIGQRIYTYIQSRFYRAPEIILGIPYTMGIDMWSLGCITAELFTGYPLFPGENEIDQLAYIMEICGVPSSEVLSLSSRKHLFFDKNNEPIIVPNSRGKERRPNTKSLDRVIKCQDENFLSFLNGCFVWNPTERMTPLQALQHPWILEGLPEKVLQHHKKMFCQVDDNRLIKRATMTDIQGFPPNAQTQNIYEIVESIRKEEQDRDRRREELKQQQEQKPRSTEPKDKKAPRAQSKDRKSDISKILAAPEKSRNAHENDQEQPQDKAQESAGPGESGYGQFNQDDKDGKEVSSQRDKGLPKAKTHTGKKVGQQRNAHAFHNQPKGSKSYVATLSPSNAAKKNLQNQFRTVHTKKSTDHDTTWNEEKTPIPVKAGKSANPKGQIKDKNEQEQIQISVELSQPIAYNSAGQDQQYFRRGSKKQQESKESSIVQESFAGQKIQIQPEMQEETHHTARQQAQPPGGLLAKKNPSTPNQFDCSRNDISPEKEKQYSKVREFEALNNQIQELDTRKVRKVGSKSKPRDKKQRNPENDPDDTLDEEDIIRDVGQERLNERMKMQSQIKSQLDSEQRSRVRGSDQSNRQSRLQAANEEFKTASAKDSERFSFDNEEKEDSPQQNQFNVDEEDEDDFDVDISENLHQSGGKGQKRAVANEGVDQDVKSPERTRKQVQELAVHGLSPQAKIKSATHPGIARLKTNKVPQSITINMNDKNHNSAAKMSDEKTQPNALNSISASIGNLIFRSFGNKQPQSPRPAQSLYYNQSVSSKPSKGTNHNRNNPTLDQAPYLKKSLPQVDIAYAAQHKGPSTTKNANSKPGSIFASQGQGEFQKQFKQQVKSSKGAIGKNNQGIQAVTSPQSARPKPVARASLNLMLNNK